MRREAQFIRRREDIITLRPGRECAGFDGFVERSVGETDKFFQKWLRWKVVQVRWPPQTSVGVELMDPTVPLSYAGASREVEGQPRALLLPGAHRSTRQHPHRWSHLRPTRSSGRHNVQDHEHIGSADCPRCHRRVDCFYADFCDGHLRFDDGKKTRAFWSVGGLLRCACCIHQQLWRAAGGDTTSELRRNQCITAATLHWRWISGQEV